jgi:DNA-binding LacI/PurR family transcriptional regulator
MDRLSTAIEAAAGQQGYDILVHCNFKRGPEETYRAINGGRADGLLMFAPLHDDPLIPLLKGSRLPIVLVNGMRDSMELSSVHDDLHLGMSIVADKLLQAGHTRIGILCDGSGESRDAVGRSDLLRSLLAAQGVLVPEERCLPVKDHDKATTAEAIDRLLAAQDPPTAIFCWHDLVGYQALEYCEHAGILVPDRLAVMGYDGMHWPFDTRHRLASVKVSLDHLAAASVNLLDELIRNPEQGVTHRLIAVEYSPGTTLRL